MTEVKVLYNNKCYAKLGISEYIFFLSLFGSFSKDKKELEIYSKMISFKFQ